MPEGPEVFTVVNYVRPYILGKTIVGFEHSAHLPPKVSANDIVGKTVTDVIRKGKFIALCLDDGTFIVSHLRMTGQWFSENDRGTDKHLRWKLKLNSGDNLIFRDIRKFGTLDYVKTLAEHAGFSSIGADGLNLTPEESSQFRNYIGRSDKPIKNVLLDQRIISGIGNIYASEILFHSGIDPRRPAKHCVDAAENICFHTMSVLKEAASMGGCSISDYVGGSYHSLLRVYGRSGEPCFKCGSKIDAVSMAGRITFFCPTCQH